MTSRATWLTILAVVLRGVLWATPSLGAVLHIEKGRFGDVPLEGLHVVGVTQSQE